MDDLIQHRSDIGFPGRETRHIRVGGIHHKQVHTLFAKPRKGTKIGQPAIQGKLVHFEVTGVQDTSRFGTNHDGKRIRYRMVDRHKFHVKWPEFFTVTLADLQR